MNDPSDPEPLDSALVAEGREVFRFDTFGDDAYWSDTLRMHEVMASAVGPALALQVGLKVDVDALPAAVQQAIAAGQLTYIRDGAGAAVATIGRDPESLRAEIEFETSTVRAVQR